MVLDLLTSKRQKTKLILVVGYKRGWFTLQPVTHLSINQGRRKATSLINVDTLISMLHYHACISLYLFTEYKLIQINKRVRVVVMFRRLRR